MHNINDDKLQEFRDIIEELPSSWNRVNDNIEQNLASTEARLESCQIRLAEISDMSGELEKQITGMDNASDIMARNLQNFAQNTTRNFGDNLLNILNGHEEKFMTRLSRLTERLNYNIQNQLIKNALFGTLGDRSPQGTKIGGLVGENVFTPNGRNLFSDFLESGNFRGILESVFAGKRERGGNVSKGRPYLVGEKGPEMFVPNATGRINPNQAGKNINITMNFSGEQTDGFKKSATQIKRQLARKLK